MKLLFSVRHLLTLEQILHLGIRSDKKEYCNQVYFHKHGTVLIFVSNFSITHVWLYYYDIMF